MFDAGIVMYDGVMYDGVMYNGGVHRCPLSFFTFACVILSF